MITCLGLFWRGNYLDQYYAVTKEILAKMSPHYAKGPTHGKRNQKPLVCVRDACLLS
jgi:hypothetical protein